MPALFINRYDLFAAGDQIGLAGHAGDVGQQAGRGGYCPGRRSDGAVARSRLLRALVEAGGVRPAGGGEHGADRHSVLGNVAE